MHNDTRARMSQIKWGDLAAVQKLRFLLGFAYLTVGGLLGIIVLRILGSEIPGLAVACMGLLAGLALTTGTLLMRSVMSPESKVCPFQTMKLSDEEVDHHVQKLCSKRKAYWWLFLAIVILTSFAFLVVESPWWYVAHLLALAALALYPVFTLLLLESARTIGYSRWAVSGLFMLMMTVALPFLPLIGLIMIDRTVVTVAKGHRT